jgi:hemerythrin
VTIRANSVEAKAMLHIDWRDEYRIDDGTIDDEHRSLLGMANRVFALEDARAQLGEVTELVQALFRYIDTHFVHEEELMAEADYPGLADHIVKHRKISRRLAETIRSHQDIDSITQYIQHIMLDWVIRHILAEDMKFRLFLQRERAGQALSGV